MYFNALRLQQRVPIKKNLTPLASSRLRRSIGKFQFLLPKPNPMPVYTSMSIIIPAAKYPIALTLYDPGGGGGFKSPPPPSDFLLSRI